MFDGIAPVLARFIDLAANADYRQVDDCSVEIVESRMLINEEIANAKLMGIDARNVRTGINMTSYVFTSQGKTYRLFLPGRPHQGEREHDLAKLRTSEDPLIRHSDAACKSECLKPFPPRNAKGFTHSKDDGKRPVFPLEANTIQANCLQHLLDTLKKAAPGFQREMRPMIHALRQVFANDTAAVGMEPLERLAFHQEKSLPIMEELRKIAERELRENKKAEPNCDYHRALRYMLNHWPGLTEFLRTPGIPLTTSLVELANKFTKQHLYTSLTFQTEHGATVGAFFMSLIATAWVLM